MIICANIFRKQAKDRHIMFYYIIVIQQHVIGDSPMKQLIDASFSELFAFTKTENENENE